MKDDVEGLHLAEYLRVDGGASTNDLLMQLQADALQVKLASCLLYFKMSKGNPKAP